LTFDTTGDFTLDDFDDAEASWINQTSDTETTHKQNTEWKPRQKGEKIDYNSQEYIEAADKAMTGLPVFRAMKWLRAQLFDRGAHPGRPRHSVKLEFTDAPIEHCTRTGLRTMRRTRWANLSTPLNFRTNLRRKAITTTGFDQHDRDNGEQAVKWAMENFDRTSEGAPSCLIGWVSNRFEGKGTIVYGSQHVIAAWQPDEDGEWTPGLIITRRFADGTANHDKMDMIGVNMRLPSAVNRDGTPRSLAAQSFTHVGTWYSDALQDRINTAKSVKEMRKADIKARGGRA